MAVGVSISLAALAVYAEYGPIDHWVATQFYDPHSAQFPLRRGLLSTVHDVQTWGVIALGLLLLPLRRSMRHVVPYLLACVAVTTISVAALKPLSPAECPWSLQAFGGTQAYKHAFLPLPPGAHAGHCSPGAHSSGALCLLGVFVVLRRRRHRVAVPALVGITTLSLSFALCQWARGAHFVSHDLWTAFIAWTAAWALQPLLSWNRRARSDQQGGHVPFTGSLAPVVAGLAALASISWMESARAGDSLSISAIEFRGNEVTQADVMLREISIHVGERADATQIERSRQSIQDLGLFRKVEASQEPDGESVRVVFTVKEKWYLLVYPRLSANTDGQNAVGAELRWNNVFGRNHSLRALASSADNREEGRGREMKLHARYRAPFVLGTPYTLDVAGSYSTTPINEDNAPSYDEVVTEAELVATRHFGLAESASGGWSIGNGIHWRNEDTSGVLAPTAWGETYAWLARIGYRDVHDHLYSETGTRFTTSYEVADQNLGSDYSYSEVRGDIRRSLAIGHLAHQTLEFSAAAGSHNNGPPGRSDYTLGGSNGLRGYDRNQFEGDFYYLLTAAYLRPIHWNWLRFVATFEAGNVYAEADQMNTNVRTSVELGLRIRVPRLVNFEFELGYAFPLDDDSGRIYGSRNGF